MTDGTDDSPREVPWWIWLLPDVFVAAPAMAALFGGAWAVVLFRGGRAIAGSCALLAWLAYLAFCVRFLSRRRYTSFRFALTVALLALAIPIGLFILA